MEDIEVHGWVGDQSPADIDLFGHGQVAAFQGCPKLRRVGFSFDGNPQAMDLHRLNLPWGQLSVLNLGSINPIFCLNILRECILLQECNLLISFIDNAAIDELTAISKQPVLLPSLHTLFLWATNHPTLFLDALHLPDLRTFCPTGKWDGFRWSSSSLKSFLRLDTLNLALVKLMENDLWEFLRPFRWLTTLHLPMTGLLASTTLQGLGSGMLIPSVTSINFGQENIEGLISLLEERLIASRAAGSEISMFTLVSPGCVRPIGPAVILRLEALEAAGVRLKFSRR
ncbi:hypothetical protein BD779DRAFT_1572150 [Infundibulicybe gibba]|nr:hypothetical protein BD779DRAFT_1572150 [Infundibulicybe gibba]